MEEYLATCYTTMSKDNKTLAMASFKYMTATQKEKKKKASHEV
jgi:hypothetical protein